MQYLEAVSRSPESSWYRLRGDYEHVIQRWVVSTPQTVRILNQPELVGVPYTDALAEGMTAALATAPFADTLRAVPSGQLCIMNFLRGSLNFDLRGALYRSIGSSVHATCFMSSQRYRADGRWHVKEDMYRKLRLPKAAWLLMADVVATGVTVDNGLQVLLDTIQEQGVRPRGLVFFTIGCHKIEKILNTWHTRLSGLFPEYAQTHVVYIEGKLRLVDSSTRLTIAIPGTDLVKLGAWLAPEFERSQYDSLSATLERCAIYDAGSRAFDVGEYLDDVEEYWTQVGRLAKRSRSLREALRERWPEVDYVSEESLVVSKAQQWRGVDEAFVRELWGAHQARWSPEAQVRSRTPEALLEVVEAKLASLHGLRVQGGV